MVEETQEEHEYMIRKSARLIELKIDTERVRFDAMQMLYQKYRAEKEYYELMKKKLEEI